MSCRVICCNSCISCREFNELNNTGAQMSVFICHMTPLKLRFKRENATT